MTPRASGGVTRTRVPHREMGLTAAAPVTGKSKVQRKPSGSAGPDTLSPPKEKPFVIPAGNCPVKARGRGNNGL